MFTSNDKMSNNMSWGTFFLIIVAAIAVGVMGLGILIGWWIWG